MNIQICKKALRYESWIVLMALGLCSDAVPVSAVSTLGRNAVTDDEVKAEHDKYAKQKLDAEENDNYEGQAYYAEENPSRAKELYEEFEELEYQQAQLMPEVKRLKILDKFLYLKQLVEKTGDEIKNANDSINANKAQINKINMEHSKCCNKKSEILCQLAELQKAAFGGYYDAFGNTCHKGETKMNQKEIEKSFLEKKQMYDKKIQKIEKKLPQIKKKEWPFNDNISSLSTDLFYLNASKSRDVHHLFLLKNRARKQLGECAREVHAKRKAEYEIGWEKQKEICKKTEAVFNKEHPNQPVEPVEVQPLDMSERKVSGDKNKDQEEEKNGDF